jgi:AhpD family alkylhydroperoxidase
MNDHGAYGNPVPPLSAQKSLEVLVRIRASQLSGCVYCCCAHSPGDAPQGEGVRRLATVAVWRQAPFFSERERAALEWTEAVMSATGAGVSNTVWARVQPLFTARELADLSRLLNTLKAWTRFAIASQESAP